VRIVDANVLLYAVNSDAVHHETSRTWLDRGLAGSDRVGLAWVPLLAFVRLVIKEGLFPRPMSPRDAMAQVEGWLGAPGAVPVNPTARHTGVLAGLLAASGTGGNLVSDAHVAALALEHRAEVVSYDADFGRFEGVRWRRPDQLLQ
jgi:toxin-antitoxin system PIN domain toxin